ncbi:mercuric reductase [Clostridia bacterium]|nr:mercuric reductase [Clostridia bacterium]
MTNTLNIGGMSCEHCVAHVTSALAEIAGVRSVKVSLKDGNAVVEHSGVDLETLKAAIEEAGYENL